MTFGSPISGNFRRLSAKTSRAAPATWPLFDRRRKVSFVDELPRAALTSERLFIFAWTSVIISALRTYGRVQRDKVAFGQKLIERQSSGQFSCRRFVMNGSNATTRISNVPPEMHSLPMRRDR